MADGGQVFPGSDVVRVDVVARLTAYDGVSGVGMRDYVGD